MHGVHRRIVSLFFDQDSPQYSAAKQWHSTVRLYRALLSYTRQKKGNDMKKCRTDNQSLTAVYDIVHGA